MTSPEKREMSTHMPECLLLPIKTGVDKQGRKYIGEVLTSLLLDPNSMVCFKGETPILSLRLLNLWKSETNTVSCCLLGNEANKYNANLMGGGRRIFIMRSPELPAGCGRIWASGGGGEDWRSLKEENKVLSFWDPSPETKRLGWSLGVKGKGQELPFGKVLGSVLLTPFAAKLLEFSKA